MKIKSAHPYMCPHCKSKQVAKLEGEENQVVVGARQCSKFLSRKYWLVLQYGKAATKNQQIVGVTFMFTVTVDDPHKRRPAHLATEIWKGNIQKGGIE